MISEADLQAHQREATTPMDDGTLLADCLCGETYSVPQGGGEYEALEAERRAHISRCIEATED